MAYIYDQPTLTGGMDQSLVEVVTTVPSFIPSMLLFVFSFVFISGMATQKRRTGYADAPIWSTMASISTLIVTLLLSIKPGLVNIETLAIIVSITIFSGFWLFLSRGRGEI